jgi:hypothetical protein
MRVRPHCCAQRDAIASSRTEFIARKKGNSSECIYLPPQNAAGSHLLVASNYGISRLPFKELIDGCYMERLWPRYQLAKNMVE